MARARGSAELPRMSPLRVSQPVQRAPEPPPPGPLRPPVFSRPAVVQRHDPDTEPAPEPAPVGRPRSNAITERPSEMPLPPQPTGRARSNAITERPPALDNIPQEPPPFTRPRSNAIVGPPPELNLGPTEPPTNGQQGGWQKASPTAPPPTEPLPLAMGRHRAPPEDEGGEDEDDEGQTTVPSKDKEEEKEQAPPVDLVKLAHDVLPHLKRLMLVERERRPRG